jgi:hypothetical protein
MEATRSSKTSVGFQQTTRRYIAEERILLYLLFVAVDVRTGGHTVSTEVLYYLYILVLAVDTANLPNNSLTLLSC